MDRVQDKTRQECGKNLSCSMKGMRCATAFFMTRADLMTCGRNILPAPNKSPTTLMPCKHDANVVNRHKG